MDDGEFVYSGGISVFTISRPVWSLKLLNLEVLEKMIRYSLVQHGSPTKRTITFAWERSAHSCLGSRRLAYASSNAEVERIRITVIDVMEVAQKAARMTLFVAESC